MILAAYACGVIGVPAVILGHEGAKGAYVVYKAGRLIETKPRAIVREISPSIAA